MTENTQDSASFNNPHDKFFKSAFSMMILARPFIMQFVPPELLDKLDLDTLEIDSNSYVNNELKEHFSDLVWSCQLKNSAEQHKIAFLFEHKSYKMAYPHFQIMDYQLGAWRQQIAAKQKPVPILPILFYHGQSEWKYEPFDSYFGAVEPEMLRFMPCFDYIFINLQDYSDAQIQKLNSIFLQKTLIAFKHYWDRNFLKLHIVEILLGGYDSVKMEQTRTFIQFFAVYLAKISGITRQEVIEKAKQSNNNSNIKAMSIIEEFIEEGIQIGEKKGIEKGRIEGIEKAKAEDILKLYRKGLSIETIADYLDYPLEKVKKIIAANKE